MGFTVAKPYSLIYILRHFIIYLMSLKVFFWIQLVILFMFLKMGFCILFSLTLIHLIPLVFFMNEARTSLFGDIFTYDYSQGPRRPKDTDILVGQLIQAHARHQRITLRQLNMTFSERGNKSYNNVPMKYLHERGYIHLNREPGRTRVTQILINRINECNLNVPTEYRAENTNR